MSKFLITALAGVLCFSYNSYSQWTPSGSNLYPTSTATNVGIGNTAPGMKLDVTGDAHATRFTGDVFTSFLGQTFTYDSKTAYHYGVSWFMDSWNTGGATCWLSGWGGIKMFTGTIPRLSIANNGNVSIGTLDAKGYKLAVAGNIIAEKVVVKLQANWPDYVFDSSYELQSLSQVEHYIRQNKHLPGIAPMANIQKDGLDLGENQTKLLQKIEELTLYMIEQKKEITFQSSLIEKQQKQLDILQAKLEQLRLK